MNLLRFGIVGSGKMAHVRAERIIKNPRAQLTCIASRNHSTGQELADAIPGSEFFVMNDCGHRPQFEDAVTFNRIHLEF